MVNIELFQNVDWQFVETMFLVMLLGYILMRWEIRRQSIKTQRFIGGLVVKLLAGLTKLVEDSPLGDSKVEHISRVRSEAGKKGAAAKKRKTQEKSFFENVGNIINTVQDIAEVGGKVKEIFDEFAPAMKDLPMPKAKKPTIEVNDYDLS